VSNYIGSVPDTDREADWRDEAACRQVDPDLFFAEGKGAHAQVREATRVCLSCPVRLQCQDHAIEAGEAWGVWGGMSQIELRTRRRRFTSRAKTDTRAAS
jgi:WhiB family redox-sensing transcriptional regulator